MKPQDILPPVNDSIDTEYTSVVSNSRRLTLKDLEIEVETPETSGIVERPRRDVGH